MPDERRRGQGNRNADAAKYSKVEVEPHERRRGGRKEAGGETGPSALG